jgi:hypothetical protein
MHKLFIQKLDHLLEVTNLLLIGLVDHVLLDHQDAFLHRILTLGAKCFLNGLKAILFELLLELLYCFIFFSHLSSFGHLLLGDLEHVIL